MRLDLTLVLYWGSLGISAAAVILFLWLMRESRDSALGTRDSKGARDSGLGTGDSKDARDSGLGTGDSNGSSNSSG